MSESPVSDAAVLAWTRLVRAHQVCMAAVERALRQAGLPPLAWYDVLLELNRAGDAGLRPLVLESRLLLAQHNVSRLIDRLEAADLVSRAPCAGDGRGQIVRLEPPGRDVLDRMWPVYAAAVRQTVEERLDEAQTQTLIAALDRLIVGQGGQSASCRPRGAQEAPAEGAADCKP